MSGIESDPVAIAQMKRHLTLLEKVKNNQTLSPKELDELSKLEKNQKDKKASKPAGKRKKTAGVIFNEEHVIRSQKAAAAYVGKDVRTIRRWKKEGGMPTLIDAESKKEFYIKALLDFFKENEGKPMSETRQRQELGEADIKQTRARLLEIELEIKEGKLISLDDVNKGRVSRIQAVKQALLGQGKKLALQLANLRGKGPGKIQGIIDKENKIIIRRFAGQ